MQSDELVVKVFHEASLATALAIAETIRSKFPVIEMQNVVSQLAVCRVIFVWLQMLAKGWQQLQQRERVKLKVNFALPCRRLTPPCDLSFEFDLITVPFDFSSCSFDNQHI